MSVALSVIIPACNEAGWIDTCLGAVLGSRDLPVAQVIVVASGCTDDTAARARTHEPAFAAKGWGFDVLDLPALGKPGALDAGDASAVHGARVYLDADVTVSPPLLAQIAAVLAGPGGRYASGRPRVTARGWFSRAYARFWTRLPFVAEGVPGFGLFAVNAEGRARWATFPAIISDDTFVRTLFTPSERHAVPAPYDWPLVEGFSRLVRVRRRQDQGVAEMQARFPAQMANEGKSPVGKAWLLRRLVADPLAFAAYAAVSLAVRWGAARQTGWVRGR